MIAKFLQWLFTDRIASIFAYLYLAFANTFPVIDYVNTTIDQWMGGLPYEYALKITAVIQPVAWCLVSLFLLLELSEVMKKNDARGIDTIYFVGTIFLKVGSSKLLMDNMDLLLKVIFGVPQFIIDQVTQATGGLTINMTADTSLIDKITELVSNSSAIPKDMPQNITELFSETATFALKSTSVYEAMILIGILIIVLLGLFLSACGDVYILVILIMRYVEILVWMTVGPLAIATAPSREYSKLFKGWVNRMVGICLQPVFIIVIMALYKQIVESGVLINVDSVSSLWGLFMPVMALKFCVIYAVGKSGKWAVDFVNGH